MQLSRREFLKVAGTALGGVALEEGLRNFAVGAVWGFTVRPDLSAAVVEEGRKALPTGFFGWRNRGSNQDIEPTTKPATSSPTPTLRPTNTPTIEPAATSVPTLTPEPSATTQPTPTEAPIEIKTMIFDRGSVDPSTVKLIINPVNNDDIGRYYDQGSVTTVFVLPEKIFLAKDGKYYCKCYLDTGDPVIFQVGEVRTYVAGERIKLVEESQYGKLPVDFGNRTAGVNIRAQRPSGGWTIRRIRSYLLDATKEVTSLSVQITLTK